MTKIVDALKDTESQTFDLADGRKVRIRVEVDQDTSVSDFDCYGKVEWIGRNLYDYDGRRKGRPDGFDGNAEKLWTYESGAESFWWQPPKDGPKRTDPEFAAFKQLVRELVTWGFKGVVVEVLDGEDAYHRPIVRDVASLWGIDSLDDTDLLAEYVSDLLIDVGLHRDTETV